MNRQDVEKTVRERFGLNGDVDLGNYDFRPSIYHWDLACPQGTQGFYFFQMKTPPVRAHTAQVSKFYNHLLRQYFDSIEQELISLTRAREHRKPLVALQHFIDIKDNLVGVHYAPEQIVRALEGEGRRFARESRD